MSTVGEPMARLSRPMERRFYPRVEPSVPLFISFGIQKDAMLLNVSENGFLISTPKTLDKNLVCRVSLQLNGLPNQIQIHGRVLWTNEATHRAGVQMLDLSEYDREQIRKWGAVEASVPARQRRSHEEAAFSAGSSGSSRKTMPAPEPLPAPEPATSSFAPPVDPPAAVAPIYFPSELPAIAHTPQYRRRSVGSYLAAIALWGVVAAIAGVGAVFFLENRSPRNLLASSSEVRKPATTPTPAAAPPTSAGRAPASDEPLDAAKSQQETAVPSNPASSNPASSNPGSPVSANDNPNSASQHSTASRNQRTETARVASSPEDSNSTERRRFTPSYSAPLVPSTRNDEGREETADNTEHSASPLSVNAPEAVQSVGGPRVAGTGPAAPPPTASSAIVASTRPTGTASSNAPSTASTRRPDNGVIQMDAPQSGVMEIRPPVGLRSSFLDLPGERVVEAPSMTMHIQRSVLMPSSKMVWPFSRQKKVVLGELVARVDPQTSAAQSLPGDTVRVLATIGKDGRVEEVKPLHGPSALMSGVLKAVREWRYQPTWMDDRAVETRATIVVQFHPSSRVARQ